MKLAAQVCIGFSVMAGKATRDILGIEAGHFVKLSSHDGDYEIIREVHQVPAMLVGMSADTIFIGEDEFELLKIQPGERISVEKSDSTVECP